MFGYLLTRLYLINRGAGSLPTLVAYLTRDALRCGGSPLCLPPEKAPAGFKVFNCCRFGLERMLKKQRRSRRTEKGRSWSIYAPEKANVRLFGRAWRSAFTSISCHAKSQFIHASVTDTAYGLNAVK